MANWYINTTGSDGSAGSSEGAPLRTITGAQDKASNGDTIYIMPGTYDGSICSPSSSTNIAISKNINIIGYGVSQTKINNPSGVFYATNGCDALLLKNIYFSGNVLSSFVSNYGNVGSEIEVNNCFFDSITPPLATTELILFKCYAYDNRVLTMKNCIIKNVDGGTNSSIFGFYQNQNGVLNVYNNIVYYSSSSTPKTDYLFEGWDSPSNVFNVKNNIFACYDGTILIGAMYPGETFNMENNCWYNWTRIVGANDITLNPKIVSPNLNVFSLRPDSPCHGIGLQL